MPAHRGLRWIERMLMEQAEDPEMAELWLAGRDDELLDRAQDQRRQAILAAGGEIAGG